MRCRPNRGGRCAPRFAKQGGWESFHLFIPGHGFACWRILHNPGGGRFYAETVPEASKSINSGGSPVAESGPAVISGKADETMGYLVDNFVNSTAGPFPIMVNQL